jgi:hypothetical protein
MGGGPGERCRSGVEDPLQEIDLSNCEAVIGFWNRDRFTGVRAGGIFLRTVCPSEDRQKKKVNQRSASGIDAGSPGLGRGFVRPLSVSTLNYGRMRAFLQYCVSRGPSQEEM